MSQLLPRFRRLWVVPAWWPISKTTVNYKVQWCDELVRQATDSTVFFFNVLDNCSPLGFIKTPSPVTALDWAPLHFVRI